MFLIRTAFWLSLLILILPTDEQDQKVVYGNAEAAVKDLTTFCSRNPDVCEASKDAATTFSKKAQFGARMVMDFFQDATATTEMRIDEDRASRRPSFFRRSAQSTLTEEDMRPSWSVPTNNGV